MCIEDSSPILAVSQRHSTKAPEDQPTRFAQFPQEENAAMKALQQKLISPPVLGLPRHGRKKSV